MLRRSPQLVALTLLMSLGILSTAYCQNPKDTDSTATKSSSKIKALIIDGQNNHGAWPKTTIMMKHYLENSGKFTVDVARTKYTWNGADLQKQFPLNDGKVYEVVKKPKSDPDFKPDFSQYQVVISNFGHNAAEWPEETRKSFTKFVSEGGGFVSIHAADNSFPAWAEYNEMIGLGGWGGRTEKSGPYVYYNEAGEVVRDTSKGRGGGHGPQHEFSLVVRNDKHPITQGLPTEFLHSQDELYEKLRGPATNMTVLATAFAAPDKRGSGRHEPMLMVIDYGQGRVFHSTLGHADYSVECVGFITTFLRGCEWCATGKVTIPVPKDFPTADKAVARKFSLEEPKQESAK